ncbi:sodium:proton antiporter [Desulfopila sp. IMCC35006]|uniref:cation:proton antiporter n=1 Tax=Desulfopila sp. IMCC35006 TaxID=2569542 RepID=UPI0010AB5BA6|nr:sodium:proton antiporter [Desulfopila sp. IMCC35006]TKB24389.1 sodium:proton antiporter [Desulfopila sp. IMCC35006]
MSFTITIAGILILCSICQWAAWRVKLPAIIFLLLTGIAVGPLFGLVNPDEMLGPLFLPFISFSVAIILFEGGLTLKFRDLLGLEAVVRNLVTIGMVATWIITAWGTRLLTGLSWELSFLFGALTVVTGPTVIIPMLKTVRPTASIATILRWEGIVIDPIGASLGVLVYEFIIAGGGQGAWMHTIVTFGMIVAAGCITGLAGGYVFGLLLRHRWIPEYLQNLSTLSLVLAAFALSDTVQAESGLVAVTVMGMVLSNMKDIEIEEILNFKESLSLLLISMLFILLAARLDLAAITELGWSVVGIFLVIQFVARPLNVILSTAGSALSWPERHLLAWIAPRGIIAAAVSALFALKLETAGFANAQVLVPLVFSVIIGTVILQSLTARPIAVLLKVAEPEPLGFLIVGANTLAIAMAKSLVEKGFRVLLADTSMDRIAAAKMEGLQTYLGNPISEHADRHLDLVGIGCLLALSHHESINTAAAMRYRLEFGKDNIYMVRAKADDATTERMRPPAQWIGEMLFGTELTYAELAAQLALGGQIKTTSITEEFTLENLLSSHKDKVSLLFAQDAQKRLHWFTEVYQPELKPGWQISFLLHADPAEPDSDEQASREAQAGES